MTKFVEENLIIVHMTSYVFDRVENNLEEGENPGNQHFLLCPQCFSKSLLFSLKAGCKLELCGDKGLFLNLVYNVDYLILYRYSQYCQL